MRIHADVDADADPQHWSTGREPRTLAELGRSTDQKTKGGQKRYGTKILHTVGLRLGRLVLSA